MHRESDQVGIKIGMWLFLYSEIILFGGLFVLYAAYFFEHPQSFVAGGKELNRIIGWIPSVKGTELDPMLKAFEPHLEGVVRAFNPNLGGETWLKWSQLYALYQVNQISYADLVAQYEPYYREQGYKDFMDQQRDWRRGMHLDEEMLAGLRASALYSSGPEADARWVKYRSLTDLRLVTPEIVRRRQLRLIEQGPGDTALGPYDYAPAVLAKIKARLDAGKDSAP